MRNPGAHFSKNTLVWSEACPELHWACINLEPCCMGWVIIQKVGAIRSTYNGASSLWESIGSRTKLKFHSFWFQTRHIFSSFTVSPETCLLGSISFCCLRGIWIRNKSGESYWILYFSFGALGRYKKIVWFYPLYPIRY